MGDKVYAKNYGIGPVWLPGIVTKLDGAVTYHIQLEDGRDIRRHADQLRTRVEISGPMEDDIDFPNTSKCRV